MGALALDTASFENGGVGICWNLLEFVCVCMYVCGGYREGQEDSQNVQTRTV